MGILVVDDEPLVRIPAAEVLRDAGFDAIEASNTAEALHLFGNGVKFRAIITDVEMPGSEDGYGLVRLARLDEDRWPCSQHPVRPSYATRASAKSIITLVARLRIDRRPETSCPPKGGNLGFCA
jgi:CheY-like chemotaxis protein